RRRHTSFSRDWSSDVCSSDLNSAIAYTHALQLSHDESTFSIEFAALTFLSPKSKVYRYKLDGYDKNWITLKGSNTAYFTKVPARSEERRGGKGGEWRCTRHTG